MTSIPGRRLDEPTLPSSRPTGPDPRFTSPQRRSPASSDPERVDPDRLRTRTTAPERKDPPTAAPRPRSARAQHARTADPEGTGPDGKDPGRKDPEADGGSTGPSSPRPSGYPSALIAYGVLKLIGLAVLLQLLAASGRYRTRDPRAGGGAHVWDVLGSWHGWWYQALAAHGYLPHLAPAVGQWSEGDRKAAALFPLYPGLMRSVSSLTGLGTYGSGMLVSVVCSFAAAAGIFAVTARLRGNRVGVIAAGLWAVFPGSGFEWAVSGESLLVALTVWSCYALMTRRWFTAAALAFLAGLDRPAAGALVAVVVLAALAALIRRQALLGPLVAALVAPLGLLGYLLWVGARTGGLFGYLTSEQEAWLRHLRQNTRHVITDLLLGRSTFTHPAEDMLGLLLLLALPCVLFLLLRLRPPLVLTLYTVLAIALALGSGRLLGDLSYYLPAVFPLLLPLATALRRLRLPSLTVVLAMAAAASGWFAGFAVFELGTP